MKTLSMVRGLSGCMSVLRERLRQVLTSHSHSHRLLLALSCLLTLDTSHPNLLQEKVSDLGKFMGLLFIFVKVNWRVVPCTENAGSIACKEIVTLCSEVLIYISPSHHLCTIAWELWLDLVSLDE